MEENSKVYRIRTKVGEDSPNVIHVPINQTYDTFEILSLKLNQTDTYKTYESGYGIIVGRVIANGGFGVPNSKVSVFIEVDDNESLKDTLLYNFTSTSDTDNNGVRYNLLPDYVESECHQDVGTFPNKRLVLDNDDVIEIFDKYWKYTTTTNNSGDYMLFGVPTGSQQLHVDIDLSDCGVLSQRPHNMIGKGYNIGMFESPNKFKSSTNLDSLPQIVTEDRGVYVYPYWGDTSNGDNTFAITRCDINIEYKFEPTAVFMGSIITDKGSNAIGKNCTATINNGKMSELVTGEGTIEMIRKTIDGRVEQFPIMGNRVIDGDGTWVYEIPMNLDYVTTDEFGNFVPTDNPDKGIATRARVRFRVRLDDTQYDNTARKRACYLIPNNPRLEDEGFDKTMEVDYEFGSLTREESYRDLFWNKVYTVKNYIPKIQKGDEQYNRQHTGIKWVNHANHNNPMPYNTLTVKLSFVHRIICILTNLVVQFVAFINQIISLLGFVFATLFDLPSVLFNGLAKLVDGELCLDAGIFGGIACVGDLLAEVLRGIGKGASAINILGRMATNLLSPTCIALDSGFCDDNVNKVDFYPGCGYFLFNLFPLSSATDVVERGDIAWEKTQDAQEDKYKGKSSDEVRTASNHTGMLHNCYENALAQENEATSFNFNNDWINGTLYAPLWYRKITPKKRFLFGLFTRKAKDEWCTSKQYFASLRYIQHCAVERDGSKTITNFDGDTTDLKFIRNSECVDGDCHERHVALPGLGGVIHSKKTMLGQDVYYYKPVEWSANLPSNELYTGKKKGELKLLFATDIVLLGSLDSCDMNGVPQFFKNLESTTYNMPGDILFTDYEFHYVIDPETGNATSNYNTQDYTVHSEMAGCDWGNPNEFNQKDGGLFYSIGCTNGETELKAKSCVNLSRICEYGVSLDVTKQIPIINNENIGNWKDASESEIEQAEDGTYYKRLITDGFISWDELYNLDERSMFATMNGNQLKTKINTNNGLKEYDFRYLYPENFDGSLAERMKRQTQNYPPEINYKFNYLLEKASRDYYLFRMGNKPYYYDSNNAFPRYENSFYFYFGLNEGKTAIEKFNSKYFAECDNEKGLYNNFNIYKKSSSWCSSLNETYDGFIALDLEKIATPYSIVITGDDTFTLDGITDEKIIFYNKSYSAPEGFEDYADNKFEEFKDEKTFIPNGSYYMTITDANEEEYHYELDMGYNFLTYSNNVQSFKKNHEDLLRSLGTNNAIMNDNTKLVYSNPEKIEREIGGVITVYGVHDNDGDIEQYKIEVREKVDFDITDIQKTIKNVGDTWYDADGNLYKVTSIDDDGTIHYTKNGEGDNTDKKKGDTVEDYEGMKKELVVPEWYDKNAVKHNLTEKDKDGKYVYEEGAQQADFNPLVKKDMEGGDTWYDANGVKQTASSGDTVVDYSDWTLELNLPTYYDKNGEKQYYPYEPNKETSAVDFEFTDRLKKLTDVGDTWYDADGNLYKVTSVVLQSKEILTVEQWSGLTTDEKVLYEEVYVKEDGEERIIITKKEWESIEDTVEKGKYAKMYRNKYVIIHYTKNGEGDYRGRDTWYDADGYFCEVTSIDTNGTIYYTKNGEEKDEKGNPYTIVGRDTVVDYSDWTLEVTPPTWYDLDGNFCKVTSIDTNGTIHYTKNGEGDNTIVDYTISGRNTVTEVTFNSSLENTPYLEYLYNLNKGDEYVKKYDLEDSDGVEYGISYKVISPYALTTDDYDKLTKTGKFDYKVYDYINKQDSNIIINLDRYNQLEGGYSQKSYDVYQYINKQDSSVIAIDEYKQLLDGYSQKSYEEVYVKNDETVISKDEWENIEDTVEKDKYVKKYRNKYDATIITPEDWGKLPTEYCKGDYEIYQYVNKYDEENIITPEDWGKLSKKYCKRDYEVHQYVNKYDEEDIISPEEYNKRSEGYGRNHYKTEITYCKIENKKEYITKDEYKNDESIQSLYQPSHVLKEDKEGKIKILIENGYDKTLNKEDYENIIVNYNAFGTLLNSTNKTEFEFYTKKGEAKKCNYDSTDKRWKYGEINIDGNYIIDYQDLGLEKNKDEVYYDYKGEQQTVKEETETVLDFTPLVRVLSFDTWLDEDGALCEFTNIDTNGTIHYTKNGESGYTIVGRNTVINYNQDIWIKTTRSDDNYSWVDKNGVTQYAGVEKLVVDYSWLLKTITQEEIVWYDKDGNIYKITSVDKDGTIHYSINDDKENVDVKTVGDIVVDFNHDKIVLTLDEIGDTWYDADGVLYEVTSVVDGIIHYTKNGDGDYTNKKVGDTVVNYYKFMTEPLYLPTWYDADGNLYKVTSIDTDGTIHYTKNGEEKYKEGEEDKPYIIVGRDTVVDWSEYIGYEGAEITYDNGVITKIKNVLWYDSEKQSFAFGVPDENRTYVITVTQLCNVFDKVFETKNSIKTNVFVSGVIKYKMFINGIDYEIIKNFDGHTGWSYNGTITKNKLTTNVGDLNENNPWFNVDKIYYHNSFGDNKNEIYPEINLKDIDRFGIDKDENQQTYRIYATEIDKEDEEVGKKVNETYHGEDGKNKKVEANDVIATFVNKRNEDDVTTYKVIDFTVKNLTVVGDTWYDADGNLCEVTSIVPQEEEILTDEQLKPLTSDEKKLYVELYANKQDSSKVIDVDTYNQLPDYNKDCYVEVYVNRDNETVITKEEWEALAPVDQDNYEKKYRNKYIETNIITPEDWGKLPSDYCKEDYAEAYVNKTNKTDVISKQQWEALESEEERAKYTKMYRNKYVIIHYTKNGNGDYRGRVTWYDTDGYFCEVTSIAPPGEEVISVDKWNSLTPNEQEWYDEVYVNKQVSTVIITPEAYNRLPKYNQDCYEEVYVNKDNETVITKEEWEALAPVDQDNYENKYKNKYDEEDIISPEDWAKLTTEYCKRDYVEKYRNKVIIIHYTKNGNGDYRGRVTWYDEDGIFCEITIIDTDGTIHYTKNGEGNYTIVGRNTVVDYSDWLITLNIIITVDTYNQLPDYNKDCYVEVYVNRDNETVITKEEWEALAPVDQDNYENKYKNKYDEEDIISPEDWAKLPTEYCKRDYDTFKYVNKQDSSKVIDVDEYNQLPDDYSQKSYDVYQYVNKTDERDIISKEKWEKLESGEEREKYKPYKYVNKYDATIITSEDWAKLSKDYCKGDYEAKDIEKYFKQYRNKDVSTDFISPETYNRLPEYNQKSYDVYNYINKQDSSKVIDVDEYNQLPDDYSQKSYDVYQYVNKTDKEDIITKEQWIALESEEERKKYKPYKYVNKYDATKFITPQDWGKLPKDYCKRDYVVYKYVNEHDTTKFITSDEWGKLPEYCQEDYTEVYLSTWYDKNGTLNYMLPSEEGQKRIDFRPLVKTIEKEGETWYDANSVKRAAGSDDISQEVLDYSKKTKITQFKEITFKTDDKTWYDKNGIENKADSDKLGLYIDITYMTKGNDTTLFNIYNKEYIDKLVIDKVEVYCQDSYDEVYVNSDDETVITKEQWETLESEEERAKYDKMYSNKHNENDIITPEEWDKLPKYSNNGYTCQYNFNRKGLHSVRIYLTLQEQETETPYKGLLSDVIGFNGCSDLNTIVLPNIGITTIGKSAFNGCKSLTSIDLPDSITTIGDNAFNGCEKLSSVYIPYQVTTIGDSAFKDCKSLTNIVLPKNITKIGDKAFANCEKLQSVRTEMKDVANTTVASNAFDNTNIGLVIYVPMDKNGKIYDLSGYYNKAGWGNVKDKVVAIELTVFNYNKVNINPSDLLDEFARNTSGNTNGNTVYYNFIDSYVASEYKAFTQVTYFKASDFVNAINNVLSRRREIADRMFNTFYMTQEGESKSFNITSNTDEMPVQPIIVYHEEEIDDVDIDYTLTTPNLTYEQINILKNVNIPTITYKSSPLFGVDANSDNIMITKSNNIEKKPLSTGIMNVKQKSIPLDSGNKDFPSISLGGGVKAINPSKTNIADLFEFPVIDKIESSSVKGWGKITNIPTYDKMDKTNMINMDGFICGRHNNGTVEHDGNFEIRKFGKYDITLSDNLNQGINPYTYAERRVITGLTDESLAKWCIEKLRDILYTENVSEEILYNIWSLLNENVQNDYEPGYSITFIELNTKPNVTWPYPLTLSEIENFTTLEKGNIKNFCKKNEDDEYEYDEDKYDNVIKTEMRTYYAKKSKQDEISVDDYNNLDKGHVSYSKETLSEIIDSMSVSTYNNDVYIRCDKTLNVKTDEWHIKQEDWENCIAKSLVNFSDKFQIINNDIYPRQYAFGNDSKSINLNIGEINETFSFNRRLWLDEEQSFTAVSFNRENENASGLVFNQGENSNGYYVLYSLQSHTPYSANGHSDPSSNYTGKYPLNDVDFNGIRSQFKDEVQVPDIFKWEGDFVKIRSDKQIIDYPYPFNDEYLAKTFVSEWKRVIPDENKDNYSCSTTGRFKPRHFGHDISNGRFDKVYCVYVDKNIRLISPLYDIVPLYTKPILGDWKYLNNDGVKTGTIFGIGVDHYDNFLYFRDYDYTISGIGFRVRANKKGSYWGYTSTTRDFNLGKNNCKICYKENEGYYYWTYNAGEEPDVFKSDTKDIHIDKNYIGDITAKDITGLRQAVHRNGKNFSRTETYISIKWVIPENNISPDFKFISEQKDEETDEFTLINEITKPYHLVNSGGMTKTTLQIPKNNGLYDVKKWNCTYYDENEGVFKDKSISTSMLIRTRFDKPCILTAIIGNNETE